MKTRLLILLLLLFNCGAYAHKTEKAPNPVLFSYSPEEKPEIPKEDHRYFREIKRTPEYSVVEYNLGPGSVAGPMFMVKGMCGLMRARGKKVAHGYDSLVDAPLHQTHIKFPNISPAEVERQRQRLQRLSHGAPAFQPEIFSMDDCNVLGF